MQIGKNFKQRTSDLLNLHDTRSMFAIEQLKKDQKSRVQTHQAENGADAGQNAKKFTHIVSRRPGYRFGILMSISYVYTDTFLNVRTHLTSSWMLCNQEFWAACPHSVTMLAGRRADASTVSKVCFDQVADHSKKMMTDLPICLDDDDDCLMALYRSTHHNLGQESSDFWLHACPMR